jgi:hypothetical protein
VFPVHRLAPHLKGKEPHAELVHNVRTVLKNRRLNAVA